MKRAACCLCLLFLFFLVRVFAENPDSFRFRVPDSICADDFDLPLRIPPVLSANFGELRSAHFHSGLDFKTQAVCGLPVYAAADGWVSRIGVKHAGYGLALYIDHPKGHTTVYGHLESLCPTLDAVLKTAQYAQESYVVDLLFPKDSLPVERGQWIANSGNSGGSGGPHLHFEIRHTATEEPMDPLLWYQGHFVDKKAPRIQAIAFYAVSGEGVLSDKQGRHPSKLILSTADTSAYPKAWGKIGIGLKAYEYMTGTNNIYGPSSLSLFCDGREIFRQELNRFSFDETRYINSLTDYEEWILHKSWIMKSFREPLNALNVYPVLENDGYVTIDKEKKYDFRYELSDRFGNECVYAFSIEGCCMPISEKEDAACRMREQSGHVFEQDGFEMVLPERALYDAMDFHYRTFPPGKTASFPYRTYSPVYEIGRISVPLHLPAYIRLPIQEDVFSDKEKYYLALIDQDGKPQYRPSLYEEACLLAEIKEFGRYTVLADTVKPKISLLNVENPAENALFRIRIKDEESGIASYRTWIDDRWVLSEYDYKTESLTIRLDERAVEKNALAHKMRVEVVDECGNAAISEKEFIY